MRSAGRLVNLQRFYRGTVSFLIPVTTYLLPLFFLLLVLAPLPASAQVDVLITPPEAGSKIAIPPMCTSSSKELSVAKTVATTIRGDLSLIGEYQALGPEEYPAPLGACTGQAGGPFDATLNALGVSFLVSGKVRASDERGSNYVLDLFLFDAKQEKAVLGKRYQGKKREADEIAHRFANEIMRLFTGQGGAFGSKIVFVSTTAQGAQLSLVRLGDSKAKKITRAKGIPRSPTWSPDGKKIIFTQMKGTEGDLFSVSGRGGKAKQVTFLPGTELDASLSPDGKSLVSSVEISGTRSLAVFNLRGRLTSKLTESLASDSTPSWSPDGETIAFSSNLGSKNDAIYLIAAGGGMPREWHRAPGADCEQPSWSPSGSAIVFVCKVKGSRQVFMKKLEANEAVQLTFQGDCQNPSFSPNEQFIAYSRKLNGTSNIAVYSLKSLKTTFVLESDSEDSQPAWSPLF